MMPKANKMTPQDALNLLDQVSAQATGNRDVHEKIKEAVEVLQHGIDATPEPKKDLSDNHELGNDE